MKKAYQVTFLLSLIVVFLVKAQDQHLIDQSGRVQISGSDFPRNDHSKAETKGIFKKNHLPNPGKTMGSIPAGASDLFHTSNKVSRNSTPTRPDIKTFGIANDQRRRILFDLSDQGFISSSEYIRVLELNADGSRIVIGTDEEDTNGINSGGASIFENSGGTWAQLGSTILGEQEGDFAGYSVSISGDGSTVAVASEENNLQDTTGYVRIFRYSGGEWLQVGQPVQGALAGDALFYREAVSLNQDGSVLAFSSDSLYVYRLEIDTWVKDPKALVNGSHNVSISADGNTLVAGSAFGSATLFHHDGSQWSSKSTVTGSGFFGFSVDVSNNGQYVGVGSVFEGVFLYEVSASDELQLVHFFPEPPASIQFGWDVGVEDSGTKLAVADNIGSTSEIYTILDGFWYVQDQISTISNSVSFDVDGTTVAIGGFGLVQIFDVSGDQNIDVSLADSLALVELYEATSDSGWISSSNWLEGPVVTWYGITVENNEVTEVNLEANNLSGSLPASIGDLDLTSFDVSDNQLIGTIPVEIGNWSNLTFFDIRSNSLVGSLPEEIGDLSQLRNLEIYNNQLSGELPAGLTKLTNLERLSAGQNQFSGTIPTGIGSLTNLHTLYLWGNNLTGSLPSEIGNLSNIVYMEFSDNQLSGEIPPELGNLNNMITFYLWGNDLSGAIPPELGNLSSLVDLGLSSNQLTGEIPSELGNLSNLSYLSLSSNQLTGEIPIELSNLSGL